MRLAAAGLFAPRWSSEIHAEWTRNLLASRPDIPPAQLARTQRLMDTALPSALVTGYESRIASLALPDAGDRHVLAAAVESKFNVIVTFNLKHFPAASLAPYGIKAITPDVFTLQLYKAVPDDFSQAVQVHRASLTRPPKTAEEYIAALAHGQLPRISAALSAHIDEI